MDWHNRLYDDGEEITGLRRKLQAEIREKEAMKQCIDVLVSYIEAVHKTMELDGNAIVYDVLAFAKSEWDWSNED